MKSSPELSDDVAPSTTTISESLVVTSSEDVTASLVATENSPDPSEDDTSCPLDGASISIGWTEPVAISPGGSAVSPPVNGGLGFIA
ncbi:hypothetical protein GCK72_004948 [Caenorhabditis remanei]|uniref:Uncharacterized protein n=1 Tax=Caenorhabditis remanei TaxID=31234 RepID=A0A6A5HCV9_CAERE|nr:hypothetical protein GCK72_004948 [Caenorhabditis remanei]KAF1764997.1 hypothetical protein GCK72_004948 [Caenorhabditis remanei]